MPPWSSRLLSSSSTSNINQQSPAPANADGTAHQPRPVLSGLDPPTLRPHVASTPPGTRRHGRSISHPFPSIFGGGSKKDKKHSDKSGDFESTDDEVGSRSGKDHSGSPKKTAPGASPAVPEKDLVLGRCMTCDSQVRWPRGLKTFRCTVCLAINDLEPFNDPPPPPSSAKRGAESYPGVGVTRKGTSFYFYSLLGPY
jgi:E3 ubiquitin-protein ligase HECTD2